MLFSSQQSAYHREGDYHEKIDSLRKLRHDDKLNFLYANVTCYFLNIRPDK